MNDILSKLDYLHDAVVIKIKHEPFDEDNEFSKLTIIVKCHPDCELEEWNGKSLSIRFDDVVFCKMMLLGHVANPETIDSFYESLSDASLETIKRLEDGGIIVPNVRGSFSFHSGSDIEFACYQISVSLLDPTP